MCDSTVCADLWTQKLNLLNKQCFCRNIVWSQKLQQVFKVLTFGLGTAHNCFATHLLLSCRWYIP